MLNLNAKRGVDFAKTLNVMFAVVFCLFGVIVLYSFITVPFTGDIQVFMAAANQVKYQESVGLLAVFEAWELKGIGNRLLIYLVYAITTLFVPFKNTLMFQSVSKLVYAIWAIILMGGTACLLPIERNKKIKVFLVEFLSVFATFTAVQMQAEMSCVILCLFAIACILHGKKWSCVLSGIIGASLIYFKSIFVLLYIIVLLAVVVYSFPTVENNKQKIGLSVISMIVFEVLFTVIVAIVYPQEFSDMAAAADYQSTLLSLGSNVKLQKIMENLEYSFFHSCLAIPFLIVGVISAVMLAVEDVKNKHWVRLGAMMTMWVLTIDLIVVSNTYFIYHYFLLILPGVICIFTWLKTNEITKAVIIGATIIATGLTLFCLLTKDGNIQTGIINYSTVLLVCIHLVIISLLVHGVKDFEVLKPYNYILVLAVALFFWMNYSSVIADKHQNLVALSEKAVESFANIIPGDWNEEDVLFLDGGNVPFYSDAPSYSRYFFNLPMQRWENGDDWDIQKQEYEKLMNYNGKYIVFSSWFKINKYPALAEKINAEYEVLANSGLYEHSPEWNMFRILELPDLNQVSQSSSIYIMIRKE